MNRSSHDHHHDDAVTDAARQQSALTDFDASRRATVWDDLDRAGAPLRPDPAWDAMTRHLAETLGVPVAAINLIDRDGRQIMVGMYPTDFPRHAPFSYGFCPHALLALDDDAEPFEVHDANDDPAHRGNELAQAGYECYRAVRIVHQGVRLGTVCVLDTVDHQWTVEQHATMTATATAVVERLTTPR